MARFPNAVICALLLAPAVAQAQDSSGCAKFKWSIERERSAFAAPGLPAADPSKPPGAMNPLMVTLAPQAGVAFVKPPGRPPRVDPAYGAVLTLAPIAQPGNYNVTLSDDAWIDVLQNGAEVRSTAFTGQPNCPGVRKSVRFPLHAGPATIQISGAPAASIKVDVVPAE